ncbi:MAG: ABC transporter substrate-binding protein [Tissierellia bacterium]|nr:ABC transporter substrate-binding protein [Tissierellia bacterium]
MKKKIVKLVSLLMVSMVIFAGCSSSGSNENTVTANDKVFKVGISQLAEHPALDDARRGFEDGLKELGVNVEIDYQNAQGDIPTSLSIAQKFARDEVDLIYAIATPAAQSAKQATGDIPIIFSAVTDPVEAELVASMEKPGANVTGTSDLSPMDRQLQLFKDLDESIEKVGIIFNTNEANSQIQVQLAEEIGANIGLEIVSVGISTINDIPQALDSLVKKVDGIYTITDNMVASAIYLVSEKALENKMITVAGEDSHVKAGILITDGISYYELGKQSAQMAKEILVDGKLPADIPSETAKNTTKVFNEDTLNALGLDKNHPVFKDAVKIED